MMGRTKSKLARSKELNLRLEEDRLSELPDPLICHILSNLPIRDTVKTSVLSTRWRSLWLWVPSLDLRVYSFPNDHSFISFGDRVFDDNRVSCIDSVKVYFDEHDAYYLTPWINALVKRKIQRLYVRRIRGNDFEMPLSLYSCETLVSLKLFHLTFSAEIVSLPCLKKLSLKYVSFRDEVTFERLVSCCPVLEDLNIISQDGKLYRLHSRSLKRLRLLRLHPRVFCVGPRVPGVVIDAPLLCYLRINDSLSDFYVVSNLDSSAKLDIHLYFGSKNFCKRYIRGFLPAISNVMDMKISENTLKVIHRYSNLEVLPLFDYMSRLHVTLPVSELEWLPTFLACCPNLKSLFVALNDDFKEMRSEEMNQISFLLGVSRITDITISANTSKVFRHNSILEPPHQFGYMSHMYVTLYGSSLSKWLPIFLESCPNLKFLNLSLLDGKKIHSKEMNQISFSSVPECLLYSLEFVDFDTANLGYDAEMELVKYFLENSAILKKLTLHVKNRSRVHEKSLLKIPRRSTNCQVILIRSSCHTRNAGLGTFMY